MGGYGLWPDNLLVFRTFPWRRTSKPSVMAGMNRYEMPPPSHVSRSRHVYVICGMVIHPIMGSLIMGITGLMTIPRYGYIYIYIYIENPTFDHGTHASAITLHISIYTGMYAWLEDVIRNVYPVGNVLELLSLKRKVSWFQSEIWRQVMRSAISFQKMRL